MFFDFYFNFNLSESENERNCFVKWSFWRNYFSEAKCIDSDILKWFNEKSNEEFYDLESWKFQKL